MIADGISFNTRDANVRSSCDPRRGWTMFQSIDRIYDPSHAARRLGFVCRTGFGEMPSALQADDITPIRRDASMAPHLRQLSTIYSS